VLDRATPEARAIWTIGGVRGGATCLVSHDLRNSARRGGKGEVLLKGALLTADSAYVPGDDLPMRAGPVPDRLTIWPIDDGRYGLDATFQGASGYERAEHHRQELARGDVPHSFRQELDGGWTLRFGPLRALEVGRALSAFVH
jgi:hypothetical protein